jgi:hypothetical protein
MRGKKKWSVTTFHLVRSQRSIQQTQYSTAGLSGNRGIIDSPKTIHSERKAALSHGLLEDLVAWKKDAIDVSDEAYVFPSERLTPLAMENVWRRTIGPKLDKAGSDGLTFR